MITKFFVVLGIAATMASAPSSAAKNPKGCSRSGARPANPRGSVLVQTPTSAVAASSGVPAMVFGKTQSTSGTAAVVPDISAQTDARAITPRARSTAAPAAKRKKGKRTAFLSPTAKPSYSSC